MVRKKRIIPLVVLAVLVALALVACDGLDPAATPASLGDIRTRSTDGMTMIYVPEGTFMMGSTRSERTQPVHEVTLDGFWIDRTEVTNAQYQKCVEAGACAELPCDVGDASMSDHPVTCVYWHDAEAYCEWVGGKLPTEAQWEYAARGPDENIYPWGDEKPTCELAQYAECPEKTVPVDSLPQGASWCGVLGMAGNVSEWTNDWYGDYPFMAQTNPTGAGEGVYKVLRGGPFRSSTYWLQSAARLGGTVYDVWGDVAGFRCVADSAP